MALPVRAPRRTLVGAAIGFVAATALAAAPAQEPPAERATVTTAGGTVISARSEIAWDRPAQEIVARGDARVVRDDLRLWGERITARYRDTETGQELTYIAAEGDMRVEQGTQWLTAQEGFYDLQARRAEATGDPVRFGNEAGTRGHADRAIYDGQQQRVRLDGAAEIRQEPATVLTGQRIDLFYAQAGPDAARQPTHAEAMGGPESRARLTDGEATVLGDSLTALFADSPDAGGLTVARGEALGNVVVTDPQGRAEGRRGIYEADESMAYLEGGVVIYQDDNVMRGNRAEVELETSRYRLLSGDGERARGTFPTTDNAE